MSAPPDREPPDVHLLRAPEFDHLATIVQQALRELRGNPVALGVRQVLQESGQIREVDAVVRCGHRVRVSVGVGSPGCSTDGAWPLSTLSPSRVRVDVIADIDPMCTGGSYDPGLPVDN